MQSLYIYKWCDIDMIWYDMDVIRCDAMWCDVCSFTSPLSMAFSMGRSRYTIASGAGRPFSVSNDIWFDQRMKLTSQKDSNKIKINLFSACIFSQQILSILFLSPLLFSPNLGPSTNRYPYPPSRLRNHKHHVLAIRRERNVSEIRFRTVGHIHSHVNATPL